MVTTFHSLLTSLYASLYSFLCGNRREKLNAVHRKKKLNSWLEVRIIL